MGYMKTGAKSDLVNCMEDLAAAHQSDNTPAVQAMVIDSAALQLLVCPDLVLQRKHSLILITTDFWLM